MPPSRRANQNNYCASVRSLPNKLTFQSAQTIQDLASAQGSRYFKVNLQSYLVHGTIEFRQHSGTVSVTKVINWIKLLDAFITESKRIARQPQTQSTAPLPMLTQTQQRLVNLLQAGIAETATLAGRLGWKPHTLRAAITRLRQAGMQIVTVKNAGQTGYRLVTASIVTVADSLYAGISEDLERAYRNRTAVLALA